MIPDDYAGGTETTADDDHVKVASTLANELRTPLREARSRLERLDRDDSRTARIAEAIEEIELAVDELLDVAADRPGSTVPLGVVAGIAWSQAPTEDARLAVERDGSLRADPTALEQALVDLFDTAVARQPVEMPPIAGTPGQAVSTAVSTARAESGANPTVYVGTLPDGFYVEVDGAADFERGRGGAGLSRVERVAAGHGWQVETASGTDGGARVEVTGVAPLSGRSP